MFVLYGRLGVVVRKRSVGERAEQPAAVQVELHHWLRDEPVGSFQVSAEAVDLAPPQHLVDLLPQQEGQVLQQIAHSVQFVLNQRVDDAAKHVLLLHRQVLAVLPLHLDALLHLLQQAAPELLQLLRDRLHGQAVDEAFEAGGGILEDVLCGVDVEDARVGFDRLEREVFREGRAVQEGAYLFLVNLAPLLELGDQRHSGLPLQPRLDREALLLEGLQAALEESIRNGKKGLAEGIIIFPNGLKGEKVLRAKQVRPDVSQPLQQVVLPPLDADFLFDGGEGLEGKGGLEITDFSESALQVHARIFPLAGDPLGAEGVEAGEAGLEVAGKGREKEFLVGFGRGDERLGLLEMEAVALGGEAFELGVDLDEQFGLQFEVADGTAPAGWSGLETCGSHSIDYKVVNSHRNVYIMKARTGCSRYRTAEKAGGRAVALRARQARRERSQQFSYF